MQPDILPISSEIWVASLFSAARGELLWRMQASGIPQKLKGLCQKIDVTFYGQ
jgi:hypothetical protein